MPDRPRELGRWSKMPLVLPWGFRLVWTTIRELPYAVTFLGFAIWIGLWQTTAFWIAACCVLGWERGCRRAERAASGGARR